MQLETDSDCVVNTAGEGRVTPGPAERVDMMAHDYRIVGPDGQERVLKTKEEGVPVRAGSVFDVRSGGGGGWGAPDRRVEPCGAGTTRSGFTASHRSWRGLMYNIGIDIGGTFTDLVLVGETGAVSFGKTPSIRKISLSV